ncbi:SAM-dependent methyltransferase [Sphingomonas oleivorans]|uniref:SAM-dependent methyltransferase n=1 Tax=Sphingomonas oleivorans TaxID=1735121 RepID=A0A2T5FTB7_9SPHN|nr:cyclopropane-fatty-acyl-phospholipid synthase family protein [Sphingomonas oleivorans]PTQ07312.1 SAM-dependent methyltransferase [Sphingomonas oleivorans]
MDAETPNRGQHLVTADRGFATGAGLFARMMAPGFRKLLDRIDAGLAEGMIALTLPDGVRRILGGRGAGPVAEVILRSWRPLVRLMRSGSVGWYRGWAEGEWASPDPVPLFDLFMRNRHGLGNAGRARGIGRLVNHLGHLLRRNDRRGARRNIAFHYDLGNDFYAAWLDRTMTYSSALFTDSRDRAEPLEAAQARKIDALLDRLALGPGERLLEIGCGWGGLAERAAQRRLDVTGITLSAEQKQFADARIAAAGLSERARILLTDYRDVTGMFDGVASVEMVEAVGAEFWPDYMAAIARVLKPGGRAAIQYITIDDAIFAGYAANADFIQTYIFPGGMLISESRFRAAAEKAGLHWRDRRGFGLHYAETLRRWRARFDAAVAEERLPAGFDERFVKLWRYYLMYCEGGFRGGGIDVAQVTLVKR